MLAHKLEKQGHRLILFSNINAIHSPWIYEEYEINLLFPPSGPVTGSFNEVHLKSNFLAAK